MTTPTTTIQAENASHIVNTQHNTQHKTQHNTPTILDYGSGHYILYYPSSPSTVLRVPRITHQIKTTNGDSQLVYYPSRALDKTTQHKTPNSDDSNSDDSNSDNNTSVSSNYVPHHSSTPPPPLP